MAAFKLFSKEKKIDLKQGLSKTREGFLSRMARAVAGKSRIDESTLDEIEEALIASDIGATTAIKIIKQLEERIARDKFLHSSEVNIALKNVIVEILNSSAKNKSIENARPFVTMVVGVNGVGKTTTIGKLAFQYRQQGLKVLLGAADTFRAAAADQLEIWSKRAGVDIIQQKHGADPAAVAFDTVNSGLANSYDAILIDTAGRLHNKINLMNELSKIRRVMQKVIPEAPHEVLLVLDASTGQNAIEQAKQFTSVTDVTAIALTKLDGTARGGVVISIADQFQIPVKYIGVGEKMDQLQEFNAGEFADSLFA